VSLAAREHARDVHQITPDMQTFDGLTMLLAEQKISSQKFKHILLEVVYTSPEFFRFFRKNGAHQLPEKWVLVLHFNEFWIWVYE